MVDRNYEIDSPTVASTTYYVRLTNVPDTATFSDIIDFVLTGTDDVEPDDICIMSRSEYNTILEINSYGLMRSIIRKCNQKSLLGMKVNVIESSFEEMEAASIESKPAENLSHLIAYLTGPLPEKSFDTYCSSNKSENYEWSSKSDENKDWIPEAPTSPRSNASSSSDPKQYATSAIKQNNKRQRPYNDFDELFDPYSTATSHSNKPLELKIKDVSMNSCRIVWNAPKDYRKYAAVKFQITMKRTHRWTRESPPIQDGRAIYDYKSFLHEYEHCPQLVPGDTYDVELVVKAKEKNSSKLIDIDTKKERFRATFSADELQELYEKAVRFLGHMMQPFEVFYRCKPKDYYDKIYGDGRGDRLMEPYLKDENGQAANAINGQIKGLFFSAHLIGASLPDSSPFGDVQMSVKAERLLDSFNLYFCDFYCNSKDNNNLKDNKQSSRIHYITVVACREDSETDKFCRERLIKLAIYDNFIIKAIPDEYGGNQYFIGSRQGALIEIYFTEAISLKEAYNIEKIRGTGQSKPKGIPQDVQCKVCNLQPVDFDGALRG